ncbi:cation:proton antiporter [Weissella paramesenteroides]|uniref:cation:proton antiporter n=1 Tax=Weissella paramesenteroides TaxID=1249 RepID=UPI00123918E6|nr:sodium:proton antiporter [Weissella paramesenteroides]KAA8447865.1 sodium:proton antiporter [Weissella paramesenteroides]KAA8450490.1 sodium:proton antiporter [Weissella paramesenteroides]
MATFYALAYVCLTIIIANFLTQAFPKMPQALWQIIGGILLASLPVINKFVIMLDPEWFMMLVIAPLLFYEGQRTQAKLISKHFRSIIELAGVLAVLTVVVLMTFGHFAIGWALPFALALAAIVTPTDATALESVTNGLDMPKNIKRSLSLESLFNDATGLVILELAILWMNTGKFSFVHGFGQFLIVAIGGVVAGGVAGFIYIYLRQHLLKGEFDDTVAHVLIYFIAPIIVFGISEHVLGVSGIIAVVVMGVMSNIEQQQTQFMAPKLNHLTLQLTDIIAQLLNGLVFVLLGTSLVKVAKEYILQPVRTWLTLIGMGLALYIVMTVFRYLARRYSDRRSNDPNTKMDSFVFAIGGVHGAVTMSMAFSLPFTLSHGVTFTERNDLLLVASTVIILSLLVPVILLPKLLKRSAPSFEESAYVQVHTSMVNAAIAYVSDVETSQNTKHEVMKQLQDQLGYSDLQINKSERKQAYRTLFEVADNAMAKATENSAVSDQALMLYNRMQSLQNGFGKIGKHRFKIWQGLIKRLFIHKSINNQKLRAYSHSQAVEEVINIMNTAMTDYIQQLPKETDNPRQLIALRNAYTQQQAMLQNQKSNSSDQQRILLEAFQAELTYIQEQRASGDSNPSLLKTLYDEVINAEAITLANSVEE